MMLSFQSSENLLCDNVEFFRAAFKGCFREGVEKTMELPKDDPVAFGYFVGWLYTKDIVYSYTTNDASDSGKDKLQDQATSRNPTHDLQWCSLWVLADKLMLEDLAKRAINQYESRDSEWSVVQSPCSCYCQRNLPTEVVLYTFENTPEGSELRQAVVDEAVSIVSGETSFTESNLLKDFAASNEFCAAVMEGTRAHNMIDPQNCSHDNCVLHNCTKTVRQTTET